MNILVRGYRHGHWQNLGLIWDKGNVVHHYTRENYDKSLVEVGDELGYSTTKFCTGGIKAGISFQDESTMFKIYS